MRSKKDNSILTATPFLAPSMVGFLLLSAIPIIFSLVISFTSWSGLKGINILSADFWQKNFVGFDNYSKILSTKEFWDSLLHVGYYIILYTPLMLAASLGIAVLLNKPRKGSVFFRVLFYIPVLTSWVAGAIVWRWVLDPQFGVLNDILSGIGINAPAWLQDANWAMPGIVLASVWKDMGFYGLIFLGGLKNINPEFYEAAQIDGAGKAKRFFRITLPMLSPLIFFALIISLINAFMLFPQVMIMTNAGPYGSTQVIVERIYSYGFSFHKMGYASALSWLLFIIVFIFTFLQQKFQKKWVNYDA
jgi:multiple sugar transport system permease protein